MNDQFNKTCTRLKKNAFVNVPIYVLLFTEKMAVQR